MTAYTIKQGEETHWVQSEMVSAVQEVNFINEAGRIR